MKKRMANMEALRIVAMMMVVLLHYLSKGEYLLPLAGEMTTNGYVAWLLEAFAVVAVNVYMLLSGYFLVESKFRVGRLVELLFQVLFYSVLVPVVMIVCGVLQPETVTIYQILQYIFPTQMLHYWFATVYVLMYVFAPILSAGIKAVTKKQLQMTIVLLIAILSISKSVLPVKLELDNLGYDAIWFMCVFLVAAYIRLYGIPFFASARKSIICYVLGVLGVYVIAFCVRGFYLRTDHLDRFIDATYSYNHIIVLFASLALFYACYYFKLSSESTMGRLICAVAPYTFGVYLLHEQIEVRYLWPKWLGANPQAPVYVMLLQTACSVLIVFVVGIVVDYLRSLLFSFVKKCWRKTSLYAKIPFE